MSTTQHTAMEKNQASDSVSEPLFEYPREVRLGLVLYGGVSLAIYMNGIALEFFRAVHGRGLYGFIKKVTNSEVIVDIISGTSAGGINGVFLAFALANNVEFGECSALWRDKGALGKLLHRSKDGLIDSLLDGTGYYQTELAQAFHNMLKCPVDDAQDACPAPQVDLDLFITGTDFHGNPSTRFDDGGHAIDLLEYRTLFNLKHRVGHTGSSESDLVANSGQTAKHSASLSKLAAITSCFPVAFAPVKVGPDSNDELLRTWANLPANKTKFFVDGGVLANKPFTPTIKTIFRRSADREVDRYLCYVEPDPEAMSQTRPCTAPDAIQTAVGSLSSLPRYQGISGDLEAIAQHNSEVQQYRRMIKAASGHTTQTPPEMYKKACLLAITNRALKGMFRDDGHDPLRSHAAKEAAARMVNCFEDSVSARDADEILDSLDVYYHRRRLFHMQYWIYGALYSKQTGADPAPLNHHSRQALRAAWKLINSRNKTLEILQDQMESLLDNFDFGWQSVFCPSCEPLESARILWSKVLQLFRNFLNVEGLTAPDSNPESLTTFRKSLEQRVDYLIRKAPEDSPRNFQSLLVKLERAESEILEHHPASQAHAGFWPEYRDFRWLDTLTYPAELVSGLTSKDLIKLIRFSPLDAKVGACSLQPKILGRQLGAFGGFLKEEWRANDILFGRLDGTCQLAQLLLGDAASARNRSPDEAKHIEELFFDDQGNFKEGCRPRDFFPHCDEQTLEPAYRSAIRGFWSPDVQAALIEAEQSEIYVSEHPNSKVPLSGNLTEFLRTGYPVRKETISHLLRPKCIPLLIKALTAAALVSIGLLFSPSRHRTV